ncbi:unnamed protein product [Somion occarium]|uniref:Autophagy-related protein 14 n=2 Tax=Somion occarium TaxID=3059160 RepID=A0ABP1CPT7_9APHY
MSQPVTTSDQTTAECMIPRRIRHITSVQIRNLTPFPVRDTIASALAQPSEQPQFSSHGRLSDDLDVTVGRKRGRRISSTSTSSLRNANSDNEGTPSEPRRRLGSIGGKAVSPRAQSYISTSVSITATSSGRRKSVSIAPPVTRPPLRQRTSSSASTIAGPSQPYSDTSEPVAPIILPSLLRDASQRGLEDVLKSRLVETYITVTIPRSQPSDLSDASPSSGSATSSRARTANGLSKGHTQTASMSSPRTRSATIAHVKSTVHSKSMSVSAVPPGSDARRLSTSRMQELHPSVSKRTITYSDTCGPDYCSPIHRPSTNPSFSIDVRNELASSDADLSGGRLRVEVWGKLPKAYQGAGRNNGKGKAVDYPDGEYVKEWKVLDSWAFDLDELTPLPMDYTSHTSHLPANTLLMTLSPPDRTFYLPRSRLSRTPSPSIGYTSDPEVDIRKVKDNVDDSPVGLGITFPNEHREDETDDTLPSPNGWSTTRKARRRTAGWQDLLKLVTVQSAIQDTKASLEAVVCEIDQLVTHDAVGILTREVSQRRTYVRELESEKASVQDESQNLRNKIDLRREELRIRRQTLLEAHAALAEAVDEEQDRESEIFEERAQLSSLRSELPPHRSSLISTLSFIYPIELISPPDLLFAILDTPLPIPIAPTDPAPPLSLPNHKDITEDVIATALGYAAQALQLLAAYMNVGLTYPVTCIGSRSLIRDGISAMVGPRMFPLFSKGVDTYRFEYGVFLLNKDIELLMAARDLRALDMRHTLPNLKNLLLTMSDGVPPLRRTPLVTTDTESILRSPTLTATSLSSAPTIVETSPTPPTDQSQNDTVVTPKMTSETCTPTTSAPSTLSRKSRTFLDLAPLAGLLRGRHPSSSRTPSSSEQAQSSGNDTDIDAGSSQMPDSQNSNGTIITRTQDDEDDRRTIRGGGVEANANTMEGKEIESTSNHSNGSATSALANAAAEKVASEQVQPVLSQSSVG